MSEIEDLLDNHPGLKRNWTPEEMDRDPETWNSLHEAICNLARSDQAEELHNTFRARLATINLMVYQIALYSALPSEKDVI